MPLKPTLQGDRFEWKRVLGEIKMKKLNLIISMTFLMSVYCLGQNEVSLRKELDILKPFAGKTWVCESTDPSGRMPLHFLLRFEPMHDGKILRFYGECKELNSRTDGYYYYDPDKAGHSRIYTAR